MEAIEIGERIEGMGLVGVLAVGFALFVIAINREWIVTGPRYRELKANYEQERKDKQALAAELQVERMASVEYRIAFERQAAFLDGWDAGAQGGSRHDRDGPTPHSPRQRDQPPRSDPPIHLARRHE